MIHCMLLNKRLITAFVILLGLPGVFGDWALPGYAQDRSVIVVDTPGIPSFAVVRPGRQTILRTGVTNESKEVVEGQFTIWLTDFPNLRFGHSFRLEPGQRRQLLVPIFIPSQVQSGQTLEARMRVSTDDGIEVRSDSGVYERVFENIFLKVTEDATATMLLLDHRKPEAYEWDWRPDSTYYTYEAVVASRLQVGLSRRMISASHNPLPVDAAIWDGYESAVLANEEFLQDASAVAAIQNWVLRGGRLWLMLDQIDPSLINGLMGASFISSLAEDVDLDQVRMETSENTNAGAADMNYAVQPPAHMRRISHSGGQVTHRIDGWPAVIWVKLGQGEVMLTTLEARAWLKPVSASSPRFMDEGMSDRFGFGRRPGGDTFRRPGSSDRPKSDDGEKSSSNENADPDVGLPPQPSALEFMPTMTSEFSLRPWVGTMPIRFHSSRTEPKFVATLESVASEQVGLPVFHRSTVASGMLGFVILLGGVCTWAGYRGHLEKIGWLVPAVALFVAVPTIGFSISSKRTVLPQASVVQIVDASAGLEQADVTDYLAVYQSDSAPLLFESSAGGDLFPGKRLLGEVQLDRRQDDLDRWQVASDRWPVGIWNMRAKSEYRGNLPKVSARFGQAGLELTRVPPARNQASSKDDATVAPLEDLVLFFPPSSAVIPRQSNETTWIAGPDDFADGETWLNGATVNDARLRRQEIYSAIFESDNPMRESPTPFLLGWSTVVASSISSQPKLPRSGQSLMLNRMEIHPPEQGDFLVPGWAMQVEARDKAGFRSSAFRNGRWFYPLANAIEVDLNFQLPIVMPRASIRELRMRLRIFAPGRTISISHFANGQETVLASQKSPTGLLDWKFTDPPSLQEANKGSIKLRFQVSNLDSQEDDGGDPKAAEWKILWMQMDATGSVDSVSKK
jgi:hypothetical protein